MCVRGVARRRSEDCALALSTNATEGVIKMAEGSGGMNASLGLSEQHPWNFTRTYWWYRDFCQLLGL